MNEKFKMLEDGTVKEIRIIPYSHHDYAWVCTRNWHLARYVRCFAEVTEKAAEIPDLVWHIDNAVHSLIPFAETCPEKTKRLAALVREGRIAVLNGGYSLARPSYVGEETYIRNLAAGRKYFRELFGIEDFPCLFNADTACGHSQLPQIARLTGHKYYRFQRPDALLTQKGVPFQFVWKGLDGSEILVTRGFYGSLWADNDFLFEDYETRWEEIKTAFVEKWLADKLNPNFPVDTVILFLGSDDCRPLRDHADRPLPIERFVREWNRREKTRMSFGNLNEICAKLEETELPVWEGVLDHTELTYNLPFKGNRSLWRLRTELDRSLLLCERLSVLAKALGEPVDTEQIGKMWYDLFEITGHAEEFVTDRNAKELEIRALRARYDAAALAEDLKFRMANAVPRIADIQAVAFNPGLRDTEQIVKFEVTSHAGVAGFEVTDADGNPVEWQLCDFQKGYTKYEGADCVSAEILARVKIPAFGYTSLRILPDGGSLTPKIERLEALENAAVTRDEIILDNGNVSAVFRGGRLTELRKDGSVLRAPEGKALAGPKFIEFPPETSWLTRFEPVAVHEFCSEGGRLTAEGPLRFEYRAAGTVAGEPLEVIYRLDKGAAGLDVEIRTDFRDSPEGMLVFAVGADPEGEVHADIPFGVEKRAFFDELYYDADSGNKLNFAAAEWELPGQIYGRNWCRFFCAGTPVALVSETCSVYYDFDRGEKEMRLILNRSLPLKTRTDRWVRQMPEAAGGNGPNDYRFSLVFARQDGFEDLHRLTREKAFAPFAVLKVGDGLGTAPVRLSLLSVSAPSFAETAVYEENGTLFVRGFEGNGRPLTADFRVPPGTVEATLTDLLGNPLENRTVRFEPAEARVRARIAPFQIVTLALKGGLSI